jgi:transcriptional regulator with XRE-family HTH domain
MFTNHLYFGYTEQRIARRHPTGIGERLKMARQMAGMSQRDLAEAANVSAMAISKYERDLMTPGSNVLLRLGRALDVRTGFFLRPVSATRSNCPSC